MQTVNQSKELAAQGFKAGKSITKDKNSLMQLEALQIAFKKA